METKEKECERGETEMEKEDDEVSSSSESESDVCSHGTTGTPPLFSRLFAGPDDGEWGRKGKKLVCVG